MSAAMYVKRRGKSFISNIMAERLGIGVLPISRSTQLPDIVINWGVSTPQLELDDSVVLNPPHKVALSCNKLRTFKALKDKVRMVPVLQDRDTVREMLRNGDKVYARTRVAAARGEGIVLLEDEPSLDKVDPACRLYTLRVAGREYRVHVARDRRTGEIAVLDLRIKRRRNGWQDNPNFSPYIKNIKHGWVFCKSDIIPEHAQAATEVAMEALKGLDLDFCAVDIIVDKKGVAYVLETNTAPRLMGATWDAYAGYLKTQLEFLTITKEAQL